MSNQVQLVGVRIEKQEVYNGKTYTVVSAPAPDSFSHPSKFRLQSMGPIGNVGSLVDVQASINGMVRTKQYFDKSTGQQRSYDEANVFLDVVGVKPHQQQSAPARAAQGS